MVPTICSFSVRLWISRRKTQTNVYNIYINKSQMKFSLSFFPSCNIYWLPNPMRDATDTKIRHSLCSLKGLNLIYKIYMKCTWHYKGTDVIIEARASQRPEGSSLVHHASQRWCFSWVWTDDYEFAWWRKGDRKNSLGREKTICRDVAVRWATACQGMIRISMWLQPRVWGNEGRNSRKV